MLSCCFSAHSLCTVVPNGSLLLLPLSFSLPSHPSVNSLPSLPLSCPLLTLSKLSLEYTVISTSTILSPFTKGSLSLSSLSQSYDFSSSEVWLWELDHKESWVLKNGCFWTVVLEKTLESPLDCKEIQPVHPKGNQSWMFTGRTDAEAETPILWPPDGKNWLIWKDLDAGKDWKQEEEEMREDEMVGWHHQLNGHEFE